MYKTTGMKFEQFASMVENFAVLVGELLNIQDDGLRMLAVETLTTQAAAMEATAPWQLVNVLVHDAPLTNDDRKRFAQSARRLDSVRQRFEGACKTLEQSRRLWMDGLN